jgi:tRNA threonylcarbamoyladenosine biosynthesis protein TsaB
LKLAQFLYIDTAGDKATIAISKDATLLALANNEQSNTHANFVQVAIENLLATAQLTLASIDAIVVTMGPGSYTGLRVGLASAKGIAYALNRPLIGLSTLALLAEHAKNHDIVKSMTGNYQIFSMIDARRMEVFGAIYDPNLNPTMTEQAIVLDTPFLESLLKKGSLVCIGNGAPKTRELISSPLLHLITDPYDITDMIKLAFTKWEQSAFENTAYSSPAYLKDFYQPPAKSL